MADLIRLAQAERQDLLALVRHLCADAGETPSLCAARTVREVVARVIDVHRWRRYRGGAAR